MGFDRSAVQWRESLSVLSRLFCNSGIVCGLPVGFQWSVKIFWRMGAIEQHDGAVVGVLPPSQASSSLRILMHFRLCSEH